MDQAEMKRVKEEFVSNLEGTSIAEVTLMTTVVPMLLIFRQLLSAVSQTQLKKTSPPLHLLLEALLDFVLVVIPTILCLTVWADHLLSVTIAVAVAITTAAMLYRTKLNDSKHAALLQSGSSEGEAAEDVIAAAGGGQTAAEGKEAAEEVSAAAGEGGGGAKAEATLKRQQEPEVVSLRQQTTAAVVDSWQRRERGGTWGTSKAHLEFFSSYRSAMMLTTCISILAVDFRIFPRRFAKVESYGTGLMDIGVGSFVFANAAVSRQAGARGRTSQAQVPSFFRLLMSAISKSLPLLLLGFSRLLSTKGLQYQEHVSEYGVHWNFFFTLAAIAVLSSLLPIISSHLTLSLGLLLLGAYEAALTVGGLSSFLLSPHRGPTVFLQNKEGIVSCIGYLCLYILAALTSRLCIFFDDSGAAKSPAPHAAAGNTLDVDVSRKKMQRLFVAWLCSWALIAASVTWVEKISRRMCNAPYVFWIMAENLHVLLLFFFAQEFLNLKPTALFRALDKHMLATFLLANVLTGVANMSFNTLETPTIDSLVVLVLYMLACCIVPLFFMFNRVRTKFW